MPHSVHLKHPLCHIWKKRIKMHNWFLGLHHIMKARWFRISWSNFRYTYNLFSYKALNLPYLDISAPPTGIRFYRTWHTTYSLWLKNHIDCHKNHRFSIILSLRTKSFSFTFTSTLITAARKFLQVLITVSTLLHWIGLEHLRSKEFSIHKWKIILLVNVFHSHVTITIPKAKNTN